MPRTLCRNTFTAKTATTTVNIVAKYESLSDLEKIIEMGFKEGLEMAMQNLDEILASYKIKSHEK